MLELLLILDILVSALGHEHFAVREAADHALAQFGAAAVPHLTQAADHRDPEVRLRANRRLEAYFGHRAEVLAAQMLPSDSPCLPWIDMLPVDYPDRETVIQGCLALSRMQVIAAQGWPEYRHATFLYIRELLRQRMDPAAVQQLLDGMAQRERSWIEQHRFTLVQSQ